ncbi:Golgin subfamily A member 7/ERF4 [Chytridium lagenaria]|nr:Golgin subfamily A member 7/ERF4 [Chytridium lagenaria]
MAEPSVAVDISAGSHKIILPRSWETGAEYPIFSLPAVMPELLLSRLPEDVVAATIKKVNDMLEEASRITWGAVMKAVGAFLFSTDIFMGSDYDKSLAKLSAFIEQENKTTFEPAGIHLVDPRRTAFLHMEILVMNR